MLGIVVGPSPGAVKMSRQTLASKDPLVTFLKW